MQKCRDSGRQPDAAMLNFRGGAVAVVLELLTLALAVTLALALTLLLLQPESFAS